VHILYVAGHPTVIRDYVNTLMTVQIRREYEVETYIGRTENLFHINKDYFPVVDVRKVFLSNKRISDYMTLKHMPPGVLPTSGVLALFAGICLGFRDIYIAGIDLYTGSEPYAFKVGPNHARLVGIDPGRNGYVHDYHRYDVDLEGLTLARDIPGVTLRSVCPGTFLAEHLSLAPVVRQSASPPLPKPKGFVRDFIPVAVPSSSGGKMSFEQRLQTYDPVRRTIVGYGERFLPARIANPIYRSLKKAGLL
jgi:alpha-2,3 sialyltransferase